MNDQCSHGISWGSKCLDCDVARAREIVSRWGAYVDESRMVIAEAQASEVEIAREHAQ
ncbi:hypothetical protein SAMN05443245_5173 [Paraburkholderia fungorum]|uniref:Uncharacterized protein n=1 Tax=Paraburkholderia fungorum TaxID=134537 RepID=A0A1H1IH18_9BURK|nr:hypothetical protein SAMN05443245_5173 [Paraburkholderia fungorum]